MASLERFWATVLTYITNVGRGRARRDNRNSKMSSLPCSCSYDCQRWSYDGSCKQLELDWHFTSVHLGSFGPQPTKHT